MNVVKHWLKKTELIKKASELGLFYGPVRKKKILNFIFQRIFRQNSDCPWSVHFTSCVIAPSKIKIGKGVERSFAVSGGCYIQGGNGITIGEATIFGPGVKIISANHDPSDMGSWKSDKPIKIGKRCWIGANAVILPGVELGDDVVVGSGAVVTRNFPSGVVIAGNPATVIKKSA